MNHQYSSSSVRQVGVTLAFVIVTASASAGELELTNAAELKHSREIANHRRVDLRTVSAANGLVSSALAKLSENFRLLRGENADIAQSLLSLLSEPATLARYQSRVIDAVVDPVDDGLFVEFIGHGFRVAVSFEYGTTRSTWSWNTLPTSSANGVRELTRTSAQDIAKALVG